MKKYDYLIVGAGLYGSVCAYELNKKGFTCVVIDKRKHIGGNCYTEEIEGINVHKYGAHIFRTSDKMIWEYMQQFAEFNNFINTPMANYHGEIYNLPFNMNTFNRMWGVVTPEEAKKVIQKQRGDVSNNFGNLEEYAISQVGVDIYNKLIKGYTEKQWGRACVDLPASIMRRIPIRYTYNNNYYLDRYQGIPIGGYTRIFEKMLEGIDVVLGVQYDDVKAEYVGPDTKIIYTGAIDEYYNYRYGSLEYRSLRFEHEILDIEDMQGVAVVNYTDIETPYTRIIEHKHFENTQSKKTVISKEIPYEWKLGIEPYYPINDKRNQEKLELYVALAKKEKSVFFGGRLGEYKYTDMQDTIKMALEAVEKCI
ncbi:MAG: UDP-galactopyranose mutase [Lachnospiraceae bacterium]